MQIPGYRIIRKINQGGMSTVYLAIQLSVGREVALKIMSPALNADPIFSERFQREANIVGQLSHPHIVSIYDIGRYKSLNYIAMDYLPGGSVHDKMAQGLSTQEALRITKEISNALDHAHSRGYIHRDIKPENILFREDGNAILSDFGVAKAVSSSTQSTNAGTVVGTPHYMSPEQARGKSIDGRSDIYSLGIVFYEMLTGSVPFHADEAVAIAIKHLTAPIPKLPAQYTLFQPILNKLLAKEPDDRFQRGQEITDAINGSQNQNRRTPSYMSETDSSTIQALSLLKALVFIISSSLGGQIKKGISWLLSWRWQQKHGFYRRPNVSVTEISHINAGNDRDTIISTRIQRAIHYQASSSKKSNPLFRIIILFLLLTTVWSGFSLITNRFNPSLAQALPQPLQYASKSTNDFLNGIMQEKSKNNIEEKNKPLPKQHLAKVKPNSNFSTPIKPEENRQIEVPLDTIKPAIITTEAITLVETPKPKKYELSVSVEPKGSRIRIMNIKSKFHSGMQLPPGRYHLQVSSRNHELYDQWIEISNTDKKINIDLKKKPIPGTIFYNEINANDKSPAMVIIPAGSFLMGNKNYSKTSPQRRVTIKQAFAVSQYEVTFSDFDKFSKSTKRSSPKDSNWGKGSRPVINVSWQDAFDYVNWLKQKTGKKYRLLSESEWEYVARAGTKSNYWWGNDNVDGKANCRRGCGSQHSNLFGTKTAPVGYYKPNPFKLYDTAGNVAEWVQDCYVDHYLGAPKNTNAINKSNCKEHSVRGGSIKSGSKSLTNFSRDKRAKNRKYSDVGFRVAVDLY